MNLLTSNLPPEQRRLLHPDFLANEQSYLRMRDSLMPTYRGQWVAIHQGVVIVAGPDLMAVTEEAANAGGHPYVAKVGDEDAVVFRIRRAEFAYDQSYAPFAMPRVTVRFWNHAETRSQTYADVIPDTGADSTALPDTDCVAFDLYSSPYMAAMSHGVVGAGVATLIYRGKADIDGQRVPAFIQPTFGSTERLIGRDILNQHRVLFDGPGTRVVFGP
jgi:predicted aspartyl protease